VLLAGIAVGFIFDFYRSLRRWMGWGKIATTLGDILFTGVALILLFRFFLKANALDLRFYILWGSVLGLFLYTRMLSRVALWFFFKLFRLIEKLIWIILEGLKIPVKGVILLMRPPYAFLCWFSLLVYRIVEVFLAEPIRELRKKVFRMWDRIFPPRTKG
jgi:spore cortex biosynthesis protein YabQ